MDDVQDEAIKHRNAAVKSRWLALSAELTAADDCRAESWRYDLAAARQIMDEDAEEIARLKQTLTRVGRQDLHG